LVDRGSTYLINWIIFFSVYFCSPYWSSWKAKRQAKQSNDVWAGLRTGTQADLASICPLPTQQVSPCIHYISKLP